MAGNAQKTPLTRSLNQFAEQKVRDAIQLLGKALPASVVEVDGSIVTIKFEVQSDFTLPNIQVPMFGPEYIRYPIQAGCKGVVFPADARLGGITGLGSGVADLSMPGNLSALVFFPVANTGWSETPDPDKLVLYGPDGVIIQTPTGTIKIDLSSGGIEITGDIVINGNVTLNGDLTASGDVVAEGTSLHTHTHGGVTTGGGTTGAPT